MRFMVLLLLVASVIALGCGGPQPSDPKLTSGKEDPRLKRASPGDTTGSNSGSQGPDALKTKGGKGTQ